MAGRHAPPAPPHAPPACLLQPAVGVRVRVRVRVRVMVRVRVRVRVRRASCGQRRLVPLVEAGVRLLQPFPGEA